MSKKKTQKKAKKNSFVTRDGLSNLGINMPKVQQGMNKAPRTVQNRGFSGKKKK